MLFDEPFNGLLSNKVLIVQYIRRISLILIFIYSVMKFDSLIALGYSCSSFEIKAERKVTLVHHEPLVDFVASASVNNIVSSVP